MIAKTAPKVQDKEPGTTGGTDLVPVRPRCTPEDHMATFKAKPVRLLDVGTGPHGKTVLLEFPDGWSRTIDLTSHADTWHRLFSDLTWEDKNRIDAHNLPPVTRHPDGRRSRQDGPLSFVRRYENKRGKLIGTHAFDVPSEDYLHGEITGYAAVQEMIEALNSGRRVQERIPVHSVVKEVFSLLSSEPFNGTSRRAAAWAFSEFVAECVDFASRHAVWDGWLKCRVESQQKHIGELEAHQAKERADFVARMKAAREAKRLAALNRTKPDIQADSQVLQGSGCT